MGWSVLSPLLTLFVMKLVFTQLLGKNIPHYTIYLFSGNLILSYYKEATRNGMSSFLENSGIITHINVPKYMFVLSRNVSALVNFALTLVVYFLFCPGKIGLCCLFINTLCRNTYLIIIIFQLFSRIQRKFHFLPPTARTAPDNSVFIVHTAIGKFHICPKQQ